MPGSRRADRRRGGGGQGPCRGAPHAAAGDRGELRAERTAVFGKTKLCKFYILGVCAKGKDCAFAHDPTEMNPVPDLSRTKICKTLINTGSCDDPTCTYAHNKEELRAIPAAPYRGDQQRAGGGNAEAGAGQKANAGTFPAAAGCPTPFSPPVAPGQGPDQAANNLAFQQWMSSMAMHMSQMMAQKQAQARGEQPPGAALGQPFLYNALFTGDSNPQSVSADIQLPSMASNNMPQFLAESKASSGKHAAALPGSGGSPNRNKMRNDKAWPERGAGPDSKAFAECCSSCGVEYYPQEANFCRSCGQRRMETPASSPEVPYSVKNTFIDVQAGHSPVGGLRNVKSAAGRLNHLAGGNTPQQVKDVSNLCEDDYSPLGIPSFPGLAEQESPLQSPLAAMGTSSMGVRSLGLIPRGNTWASDLDTLAEENKEDIDVTPANERPTEEPAVAPSGANSPEKRLQDTPFGAGLAYMFADAADSESVHSGDDISDEVLPEPDALPLDRVVVKNTFIEFAQQKPLGGMRMVQTAAGRLDMMGQGQE